MSEYTKQAEDFLKSTGTELTVAYVGHGLYFADDKEERDIYRFTLSRNGKSYTAKFGQSIAHKGVRPTAYDILACLNPNEPETIEALIDEFGYEIKSGKDYEKLEKMAFELARQNTGLRLLFNEDELNQLAEIN